MEFLNTINWELYITYAFAAGGVASLVAAIIPGTTDNKIVSYFMKLVNLVAMNFGNAANAGEMLSKHAQLEEYAKRLEAAVDAQAAAKTEKPAV